LEEPSLLPILPSQQVSPPPYFEPARGLARTRGGKAAANGVNRRHETRRIDPPPFEEEARLLFEEETIRREEEAHHRDEEARKIEEVIHRRDEEARKVEELIHRREEEARKIEESINRREKETREREEETRLLGEETRRREDDLLRQLEESRARELEEIRKSELARDNEIENAELKKQIEVMQNLLTAKAQADKKRKRSKTDSKKDEITWTECKKCKNWRDADLKTDWNVRKLCCINCNDPCSYCAQRVKGDALCECPSMDNRRRSKK
jgi:hypothetical protein